MSVNIIQAAMTGIITGIMCNRVSFPSHQILKLYVGGSQWSPKQSVSNKVTGLINDITLIVVHKWLKISAGAIKMIWLCTRLCFSPGVIPANKLMLHKTEGLIANQLRSRGLVHKWWVPNTVSVRVLVRIAHSSTAPTVTWTAICRRCNLTTAVKEFFMWYWQSEVQPD